jgi:hypothetical protein
VLGSELLLFDTRITFDWRGNLKEKLKSKPQLEVNVLRFRNTRTT